MAGWDDLDKATKDMFRYHWGDNLARSRWEWENAGGRGTWDPFGDGSGGGSGGRTDAISSAWNDYVKLGRRQIEEEMANARERLDLERDRIRVAQGEQKANEWYQRATVALNNRRVDLEAELGRGELQLKAELGRGQLQLGRDELALRERLGLGELDLNRDRLRLDRELGRGQLGVSQGNLALQALGQAAQLGGPENYFQYLDYLSGARQVPGMANWLQALQDNLPQTAFVAPGGAPTPRTMGGLIQQLGGPGAGGAAAHDPAAQPIRASEGPPPLGATPLPDVWRNHATEGPASLGLVPTTTGQGTAQVRQAWLRKHGQAAAAANARAADPFGTATRSPQVAAAQAVLKASPPSTTPGYTADDEVALDLFRKIYGSGAHKLAPGTLESLSPGQRGLMASAGRKLGYDPNEFLASYTRSRVAQGDPRTA